MAEVALTIAGGAACMTLMGIGAWLVPRLVRRSRLLRSGLARLRWQRLFRVAWSPPDQEPRPLVESHAFPGDR